ncbi:unnamed protein product [Caenorhabditis sp. 36 PRJEB53466]|nr:unnamed protein product [Caenorhabditis sp. 36 PRJEB53466]
MSANSGNLPTSSSSSSEQRTTHGPLESFAPEFTHKAGTIASLSIFGTPLDQECQPIPVVPRSSSSDELRVWRVTSSGLVEVDANTMGAFLDKPKTEKTNICGEGNGVSYGMSSMQGWRKCMEDAHIAETVMSHAAPYKDWSFFAVFDGHAGPNIATRASLQLLEHLISGEEFREMTKSLEENNGVLTDATLKLLETGIKKGFLSFDETSKTSPDGNKGGCTAVCAIITPTHIIIGNLGDSRAVICGKGNQVFGTEDHKPYLEKERKRIEDAGGSVMIQRINGALAVSRAFGDYDYKEHPLLSADQQLVSPEPDVYIRKRDKENDEFMVVACDGIYDVMTNEELASFVGDRLLVQSDLRQVCDDVLDECLMKGSRDNMTMVMVCFPAAPTVNAHRKEAEEAWVARVKANINQTIEEAVASPDFQKEDDVISLKSILDKVSAAGLFPTDLRVPAHTVTTLAQKILAERDIKHVAVPLLLLPFASFVPNMRLALVLSLVSSLQIFQQSSVDPRQFDSIWQVSLITAAFPTGKFIATCFLSFHDVKLHAELDRCARLLVLGAIISVLPFFRTVFSFFGRFIMGFSAGSGFVCAPAVLRLAVPESMRPANFLFLAAAFSMGTLLANSMFLLSALLSPTFFAAGLTCAAGGLYLVLRPDYYPVEECTEPVSIDGEGVEPTKSSHPVLFVFVLMVINVSIGVPLMQTYSTLIFTHYGMSATAALLLSISYPILQFIPVIISTRINISRKVLVLGGYLVAIEVQFFLLITSSYPFIPEKHQMIAMTVLLLVLSVSFIIPCNTALCILFEQFDGANVKTASKSRCVMWFLASIR